VRNLYGAIAEAFGIRLLYDRDLEDRAIPSNFDVADATLKEALDAAAGISATFVAPVDERTGIVAADSVAKRGEYERQVLASFHAGDRTTPQQLTEISTALRTLLDLRRVSQDTRTNWITVRGLNRQVEAAGRFFRTLEKPRGEIVIEAEVLEIDTSRAQSLGIIPPQPFLLQFLGRAGSSAASSLFRLGAGRTLYGVLLPAATADLTASSSLLHSYQVFHLRAGQDEQAQLLLGTRVPVITATVSSSVSEQDALNQGFFPQIQYQDIGVTVSATPHLHAGREITLVLDLALRNLGSSDLNGLPTFTNRQVTGRVRLKEGESYLIGGIRNRTQSNSRTGYPLLSQIPLVGRLFGLFRKQDIETELWIHLRPYILRAAPAEEFASRAIFFGKEIPGVTPPPVEAIPPTQPGVLPPGIPQPGAAPPGVFPPGVVPPGPEPPQPGVPPETGVPPQPGAEPQPGIQPQPGVVPQPGVQPQPGGPAVFPPGVFPPGVIPPGAQPQPVPGQPGAAPQPGQQQPSPFERPGFGAPGTGFTPPPGTAPQPGQQQQPQ
jgi:general secretion pathway protein D